MNTDHGSEKVVVVYWPFSEFHEVHLKKDVGSISLSLSNKGYRTTLIVGKFLPPHIDGINVYETGNSHLSIMKPLSHIDEFKKVIKKMFTLSPDIVIVYNRNPFFSLVILIYKIRNLFHPRQKRRTKFIMKMTSDGNFRFTNFPSKWTQNSFLHRIIVFGAVVALRINYQFLDFISIETECGLENLKKMLPKGRKLVVVPNGCNLSLFDGKSANSSERKKVILTVSRVVRQKSLETLIEAFVRVHTSFPEWSVKIVGKIEDLEYYDELTELVEEAGIAKSLSFTGEVSENELLDFYSTSSIFCLSSAWEDDSISRREAIAMGLSVITTYAGCGRSLIRYGSIVVPVGDTKLLASALRNLMYDEKLREDIAKQQKAAVISWDDVVESYLNL